MKYAGPTKKMIKALEEEGLNIAWPKTGNVKDEELLAIDATFYTGCDWEKLVLIDLRRMLAIDSKAGVDNAVANQLQEAYDNFDIDEEMKVNMGANGAPDAERLLEDMKEQEACLKRFAEVANAVAEGRPVPPKEVEAKDGVTVTLTAEKAERVKEILARAVPLLTASDIELVNDLIAEINRKLEG